jgi:hypothetical protein
VCAGISCLLYGARNAFTKGDLDTNQEGLATFLLFRATRERNLLLNFLFVAIDPNVAKLQS